MISKRKILEEQNLKPIKRLLYYVVVLYMMYNEHSIDVNNIFTPTSCYPSVSNIKGKMYLNLIF